MQERHLYVLSVSTLKKQIHSHLQAIYALVPLLHFTVLNHKNEQEKLFLRITWSPPSLLRGALVHVWILMSDLGFDSKLSDTWATYQVHWGANQSESDLWHSVPPALPEHRIFRATAKPEQPDRTGALTAPPNHPQPSSLHSPWQGALPAGPGQDRTAGPALTNAGISQLRRAVGIEQSQELMGKFNPLLPLNESLLHICNANIPRGCLAHASKACWKKHKFYCWGVSFSSTMVLIHLGIC